MKLRLALDPAERALAFESDGTLWVENGSPRYEGAVTLSRVVGTAVPGGRVTINDPWRMTGKLKATAKTGLIEQLDALEKARRFLAGLFPLGLESHEALAEQVADALLDGVGLDHLRLYRSRVLGVTAEQAREMAAELSPAREGHLTIVVGEADAARRALGGLCPIEVRQLEEFA